MSKTRVNCHRAVLRCLLLFALTLVILITGRAVYADPGMPLRRMPICGDQDGSENPLTFNCADFGHVPNVQTYQVPGTGSFDFQADFIYREATYNNELGFYIVDNNAGAVGELEPGEQDTWKPPSTGRGSSSLAGQTPTFKITAPNFRADRFSSSLLCRTIT